MAPEKIQGCRRSRAFSRPAFKITRGIFMFELSLFFALPMCAKGGFGHYPYTLEATLTGRQSAPSLRKQRVRHIKEI